MTSLDVVPCWAMNFGPPGKDGHSREDLIGELTALRHSPRGDRIAKLGFVTEAIGWAPLPHAGYDVIHESAGGAGMANVALYVHRGLKVVDVDYVQHKEGWSRVEHGGRHEPRVTLTALLEGDEKRRTLAVATHGPDPRADNPEAKREWVRIMVDIIRDSEHPVLMGGDPNHLFDDVQQTLGNPRVVVKGEGADAVLARGYTFTSGEKRATVGGVRFANDHHGAFVGRAVRRVTG